MECKVLTVEILKPPVFSKRCWPTAIWNSAARILCTVGQATSAWLACQRRQVGTWKRRLLNKIYQDLLLQIFTWGPTTSESYQIIHSLFIQSLAWVFPSSWLGFWKFTFRLKGGAASTLAFFFSAFERFCVRSRTPGGSTSTTSLTWLSKDDVDIPSQASWQCWITVVDSIHLQHFDKCSHIYLCIFRTIQHHSTKSGHELDWFTDLDRKSQVTFLS